MRRLVRDAYGNRKVEFDLESIMMLFLEDNDDRLEEAAYDDYSNGKLSEAAWVFLRDQPGGEINALIRSEFEDATYRFEGNRLKLVKRDAYLVPRGPTKPWFLRDRFTRKPPGEGSRSDE